MAGTSPAMTVSVIARSPSSAYVVRVLVSLSTTPILREFVPDAVGFSKSCLASRIATRRSSSRLRFLTAIDRRPESRPTHRASAARRSVRAGLEAEQRPVGHPCCLAAQFVQCRDRFRRIQIIRQRAQHILRTGTPARFRRSVRTNDRASVCASRRHRNGPIDRLTIVRLQHREAQDHPARPHRFSNSWIVTKLPSDFDIFSPST